MHFYEKEILSVPAGKTYNEISEISYSRLPILPIIIVIAYLLLFSQKEEG